MIILLLLSSLYTIIWYTVNFKADESKLVYDNFMKFIIMNDIRAAFYSRHAYAHKDCQWLGNCVKHMQVCGLALYVSIPYMTYLFFECMHINHWTKIEISYMFCFPKCHISYT